MSYDYVIVGAGAAGCVLANRLSEDPQARVLLVEAGGSDQRLMIRMPLGMMRAFRDPSLTWGYFSDPEPHLGNRVLMIPRGRVLGGSSSINGMFFMRGHSSDFDGWQALGCEGWSYAHVLPYFKKLESSWRGAVPYHGAAGPMPVVPNATTKLLHQPLMQTAVAAGYWTSEDINGRVEEGFARPELTMDSRGRRASAARAYLRPAMRRPNLDVMQGAHTTRVLIEGGRAVGIEIRRGAETRALYAEREVILCGGTYNSPQLLLLSGLGAADSLQRLGIRVRADLPGVGANLSEHVRAGLQFATREPVTFLRELRADRVMFSVLRWMLLGTGAFASQVSSCNVLIRTAEGLRQPDIQVMCNPVRMDARVWWPFIGRKQDHLLTADAVLLHPKSRGRVSLRSVDPLAKPRIQFNCLAEADDLATLRRGLRAARHIYATAPQADLIEREITPGPQTSSDGDLDTYIRATAGITQHPVGTCSMAPGAGQVVDAQLRVLGVQGLRIADASVMPTVPGGNTYGAVLMIAERAADLIRGRTLPPQLEPT
ncbi:MAG TPA: GMC family oxidoreductase N-terminal domain-containing protein [Steroidobacteraceae bacterium]|nr:GMC family oxidoreductase N-terminal domain-containing protein [Steroidobacteraceae bacterium]